MPGRGGGPEAHAGGNAGATAATAAPSWLVCPSLDGPARLICLTRRGSTRNQARGSFAPIGRGTLRRPFRLLHTLTPSIHEILSPIIPFSPSALNARRLSAGWP